MDTKQHDKTDAPGIRLADGPSGARAGFVAYEYKEVTVPRRFEGVYSDAYPSFGWEPDNSGSSLAGFTSVTLRFRRDRRIRNKAELSRLQRQFENGIAQIGRLERSASSAAAVAAMTAGVAGTLFIAGSVFALVRASMTALMIILAVPGLAGWAAAYPIHKKVRSSRAAVAQELIEQHYDELYGICEKADSLLKQ